MKLSRPAAVFAAVALLAGGTAVAVNAATQTDPVKLCANTKNSTVTVPASSGDCARGTTAFYVAADSDVRALGVRLDANEAGDAAQATAIGENSQDVAALESQNATQAQAIQALQAANQALAARVDALHPPSITITTKPGGFAGTFELVVVGDSLQPGASVFLNRTVGNTVEDTELFHKVGSNGLLRVTYEGMPCEWTNIAVRSIDLQGNMVTSNRVARPDGCPVGMG